jgi:hypothetical protein
MDTEVLGAERLKQKGKRSLPIDIWLKVLNYDVCELAFVNKFFRSLIKSNKNNICYNIINNLNLSVVYEDAYDIYNYYYNYKMCEYSNYIVFGCKTYNNRLPRFNPKYECIDIKSILRSQSDIALKIIRFFSMNDYDYCSVKYNEDVFSLAISHQNIDIIQFLIENNLVNINDKVCYNVMVDIILREDSCLVLKYFIESGIIVWDKNEKDKITIRNIMETAFRSKRLNIIKYLIPPNISLPKTIINYVNDYDVEWGVKMVNICILQYLLLNDIRITSDVSEDAYYEELYVNLKGLES